MTRYAIDPEETAVWIEARSSLHPIHSETRGMEGHFEGELSSDGLLDLSRPSEANLSLPVANMSSGNGLYDREMLRRVDVKRYPTITGRLRGLSATDTPGRYLAEGDITFRGVTRNVSDDLTLSTAQAATLVFEGSHVFNLPDFGMEPPRIMMLRVYPDVTVRVRIVARRT